MPEINFPIKTLNLPHGGRASPLSAYNLLMDMIGYTIDGTVKEFDDSTLYQDDEDGNATIQVLRKLRLVMSRMTGNNIESLGLHPAVYFYSSTGKHWDMIFVSMVKVFADAIRNNDKLFFKSFGSNRKTLEDLFLNNKTLIGQANIAIRSNARIDKWSDLISNAARGKLFKAGVSAEEILSSLDLTGKLIASEITESATQFSTSTKSAVFLTESIKSAQKCPLCGGLIAVEQSVSYDHKEPKSKGGKGHRENLQLTHPYCNSLKGAD